MAAYDDEFTDPREEVLNQIDPNELAVAGSRGLEGSRSSPSLSWTRKGVGDAWNAFQGTGTGHQAVGEFAKQYGLKWSGTDKVWNPEEGEWWDLSRNSSATGGTKGVGTGHGAKAAKAKKAKKTAGGKSAPIANASLGAAPPISAVTPEAPAVSSVAPPVQAGVEEGGGLQPQGSPFQQQMRDLLMQQIAQAQGVPSLEDPAIAAQSQAFTVARQRAADEERAMLAERGAANGLLQGGQSSGAFDADLQGIIEAKGQDVGAYNAGLLGEESQQRRGQLQNLLTLAISSGDAESARELEMRLAQMDESFRRAQLAQQGTQFDADLGYRNRTLTEEGRQFNEDLGFRNRGLSQQGSQFNADLGYRNRALSQQGSLAREGMDQSRYFYDDTMGYNQGRDAEEDYRWRVLYGL